MRGIRFVKEISKEFGLTFCKYHSHCIYITDMGKYPEIFIRFKRRKILISIYKTSNLNSPSI